MKYLWDMESWGSGDPPENAEEIIARANEMIAEYARTHDDDATSDYSEMLWDRYCTRDSLTPLNGYRKKMKAEGGNLGWCKPYISDDGKNAIAVNEGIIESMILDGEEITFDKVRDPDVLERFARAVNSDFDEYEGWGMLHIILDGDLQECDCCDCPWFSVCDAMDNPDDWEEFGQADLYPDD